MGCLFSCFRNNYEDTDCIDNDLEEAVEDLDDYYDEMNRPRFFNNLIYHRYGYYTSD